MSVESKLSTEHTMIDDEGDDDEFYTPASHDAILARKSILEYSLNKSKKRLLNFKNSLEILPQTDRIKKNIQSRRYLSEKLSKLDLFTSEIVSTRPIAKIRICPSSNDQQQHNAIFSTWDGDVKLLDYEQMQVKDQLNSIHRGKITGLDWNVDGKSFASGGEDGIVKLFSFENEKIQESNSIEAHEARITAVKYHGCASLLATSSFDSTWKLWDLAKMTELYLQEGGHSTEIFNLDFHPDGSLLSSVGGDGNCVLWDLRSGNRILNIRGHVGQLYNGCWSPNGSEIATAGVDGVIKIWDIRAKGKELSSIYLHKGVISDLRWENMYGRYLISSGYDGKIGIINADTWKVINSMSGHTGKASTLDAHGEIIISGGWDRSIRKWCEY
ncbi:hypothetical protein TBLA_0E00760 [Henningerozyma blattae CBS 6284]|uniref:Anaphase-promoting complex subunit 4-like WD40 domain-containing protein n=1 Tax=Henningerozyma blattae (strain ATCC 34711 / CBS 6284 / DSM 70876 / NBRC 10599 / NRRL Y-10934 / UCD 77-7) TaxID=1071380 RepID=I2H435_HENB6|nr:hypothetical protein TBLA_0E00760 [Tetrapisispora blattae CBS 6284]CCH61137.1 hypothetical protein TBLA_0E00760 [Tetrapisispora blattae CBS 6284]